MINKRCSVDIWVSPAKNLYDQLGTTCWSFSMHEAQYNHDHIIAWPLCFIISHIDDILTFFYESWYLISFYLLIKRTCVYLCCVQKPCNLVGRSFSVSKKTLLISKFVQTLIPNRKQHTSARSSSTSQQAAAVCFMLAAAAAGGASTNSRGSTRFSSASICCSFCLSRQQQ